MGAGVAGIPQHEQVPRQGIENGFQMNLGLGLSCAFVFELLFGLEVWVFLLRALLRLHVGTAYARRKAKFSPLTHLHLQGKTK